MRKWKKLLLPAMCAFMLQIPVIVNAEAVDSSNNVTSAVETPVATLHMHFWMVSLRKAPGLIFIRMV